MRLLAISGSLRRGSYNSALLDAAAAENRPGIEFVFWNALDTIPPYNEDVDQGPLSVALLKAEIAAADAILFATPEYNGSLPGTLKNALDWVSRPFDANPLRGKRVAVIGASQGVFGAAWAQADLRKILQTIGARVDARELVVAHAQHAFTLEGRLRDPQHAAGLKAILEALLPRCRRRAA
jgi:chromate reductase, NAD(P)H dehydrogenase (quinone)